MPDEPHLGDLAPDEFRARLHQFADWIADYRETIGQREVSPTVLPGEITAELPSALRDAPEGLEIILRDFERVILPGLVHWGHPAFLGYFGSTTTAPGILAEMLTAALNVSAMTWRTSPAATELEAVVLDWLRQMLALPAAFEGVVYDTASVATFHALAAAREAADSEIRTRGLSGRRDLPGLRIYVSDQTHSSVDKAAIALGIGEANVVKIASDEQFRMKPDELRQSIERDLRAGHRPIAVVATIGTTSSTSVDPVAEIAAVCRAFNLWLHVDAAYGGAMALLLEGSWAMEGASEADSLVVNPHKWLFVPLDFSALYVRDLPRLRRVFTLVPEYLRGDSPTAARNYMDYGIQLGRRFRALKAWVVFRAFGREGLASRIREHCRLARLFASWVEADEGFELCAPVPMAVVCFRAVRQGGTDDGTSNLLNERLVETINKTGRAFVTHTQLHGVLCARVAVGNVLTTETHLATAWQLIRNARAKIC